jgi:hypothetical protein
VPAVTCWVSANFALANFFASSSLRNVLVALACGRFLRGSSNETYHVSWDLLAMTPSRGLRRRLTAGPRRLRASVVVAAAGEFGHGRMIPPIAPAVKSLGMVGQPWCMHLSSISAMTAPRLPVRAKRFVRNTAWQVPQSGDERGALCASPVCQSRQRTSFDQVILPSLLALNVDHRAIGGLHVGLPVQRHLDRKTGRRVVSNDLNAGNGLTPWP